jgi:thymidylate synthase
MKQYLELLDKILTEGVEKESGRPNMPNTIGISNATIRMDLGEGFPLLTTKKMFLKGIIHELLWFLRGDTNIKYLVDNGVNIWSSDAYRWYLKKYEEFINLESRFQEELPYRFETQEEFIDAIKKGRDYRLISKVIGNYHLGDLGKVYGYQWRNQNGVDQIKDVIEGLKNNPYSRYHIIDSWNKVDFPEMALPPCHLLYQFIVRPMSFEERKNLIPENIPNFLSHEDLDCYNIPKYFLDLNMYQRSCDIFLGVPFNLASMSLLLIIIAKVSNMAPGIAYWIGGDTHLYLDHIPMAQEQLKRTPNRLPYLTITKELKSLDDILELTIDDFVLSNYKSDKSIKAELFTGIKK